MLAYAPPADPQTAILVRRLDQPSLVDHFYLFLKRHGANVPTELLQRDVTSATSPNEALQAEILRLYVETPELGILFELMTDFDEGLQEWRYRHVKLVQRTIGQKPGTGGSLGVKYLKENLFHPIFPDLWEIRHQV